MKMASSKDFDTYQKFTIDRFNLENEKVRIGNKIFRLKNENLKYSQQIRIIDDQLRVFFDMQRVKVEKDSK